LYLAGGKETIWGEKIAPCGDSTHLVLHKGNADEQCERRQAPSCDLCPDTPGTAGERRGASVLSLLCAVACGLATRRHL